MIGGLSEYGSLSTVVMKHARDAFMSEERIARQWKRLNYSAPPDYSRALDEYDRFEALIGESGADIIHLPPDESLNLDSIYTRDASVLGDSGLILCRMGKEARAAEPVVQGRELGRLGWNVTGAIAPPGLLEGGDVVRLDQSTFVVGEGRRTNAEGIRQLRALLKPSCDLIVVPLPEHRGQHDVMHLMSLMSPVDEDLAVVYSPLLPPAFRTFLLDRGYRLVDVPENEFETMGTNVLALAPRQCVMLEGNPRTRAALEATGTEVRMYEGTEISLKGGGGPTCLTRPLARAAGESMLTA